MAVCRGLRAVHSVPPAVLEGFSFIGCEHIVVDGVTIKNGYADGIDLPAPAPMNGESEEEPGSQIVTTTMGRAIFNDAINSVLQAHGQESLSFFNEIVDRAGLKKIVAGLIRRFGNEDTAQVLDAIKRLGFRYATQSGTTIAISDITMPTDKA